VIQLKILPCFWHLYLFRSYSNFWCLTRLFPDECSLYSLFALQYWCISSALWLVCWMAVSLTGDLRSSIWLTRSGIEGRGHHHMSQAERSWNLVGPCPPGISFNAHLPVCSLALWLLPRQMISCYPLLHFTWFRCLKPWERRNFRGLPEGVRQEATSVRACCLTQL